MNSGSQSSGNSSSGNPMTSLRKRRLEQYATFQEGNSNSEDEGSGSDNPDRLTSLSSDKKPKTTAFDMLLQAHKMRNDPKEKHETINLAGNPHESGNRVKKEPPAHEFDSTPTSLGPRRDSVPKDDKLLQAYQHSGALDEVFGSQSVLSQELISLKHHPTFHSPETNRVPRQNDIQEINESDQKKSSPPQQKTQPQTRPSSGSHYVNQENSQQSISVNSLPDLPFSQSFPQSIPQSMPYFSSQLSHFSALNDETFLNSTEMEAETSPTKSVTKDAQGVSKQFSSNPYALQTSGSVHAQTSATKSGGASSVLPSSHNKELSSLHQSHISHEAPSIEKMKKEVLEQMASSNNRGTEHSSQTTINSPSGLAPIERMLGVDPAKTNTGAHSDSNNTSDRKVYNTTSAALSSNMLRPYSAVLSDNNLSSSPPTTSSFASASPGTGKVASLSITQEAAGPHNPDDPMLVEMAELAAKDRRIANRDPGHGVSAWVPIKTKKQRFAEEAETKQLAAQAAKLVAEMAVNRKVEKQLLLSMTLTRESPRSANAMPPPGNKLKPGFHWGHFPPLEKLLRSHMEEYYELSIKKCQSTLQQEFNNRLVKKTQYLAYWHGWAFEGFTDRELRDRIRCVVVALNFT